LQVDDDDCKTASLSPTRDRQAAYRNRQSFTAHIPPLENAVLTAMRGNNPQQLM
jgi:hypothetical protein